MPKPVVVHLYLNQPNTVTSKCGKLAYFDLDKKTPAQALADGATYNEKETTCHFCVQKILMERYKAGLIKL